jgi:hypothetical protein
MTNAEAARLVVNAISTYAAKAALYEAGDPFAYGASKGPERTARFALVHALEAEFGLDRFAAVVATRRVQAVPFISMPGLSPLGDN